MTHSKAALGTCLVLLLSLGVGCRKKPEERPQPKGKAATKPAKPPTAGGRWVYPTTIRMNRSKARAAARETLQLAAQDEDADTRWMAIEALARTVGSQAGQVYITSLSDPEPAVRAAAAMAIGDLAYDRAKTTLKAMVEANGGRFWESDRRTYCSVIYGLHRLGDDTRTGYLGQLLFDKEDRVRANAALVMGKMGEPSATGPLEMLLNEEQDAMVQIQVIESLALLGDERAKRLLEACAKRRFVDEQIMAIQAMVRAKCQRAEVVIRERLAGKHPPRVRVVAAGALGRLGKFDYDGYNLCIDSVRNPLAVLKSAFGANRKNAEDHAKSLQQLAAVALGWIGRDGAVDYLYPLLKNEAGGIRVAAAMSILRLLPGQGEKTREHKARKGGASGSEPTISRSVPTQGGKGLSAATRVAVTGTRIVTRMRKALTRKGRQ